MAWLSPNWQYRKKITIQGSSGAGTNYQVLLKVGESSGASGANFHLGGHSASFPSGKDSGGDLRFTDDDGTTLLNFWVEKVEGSSPNRVAYIWVKVLDDLGSNRDIFCYYGNSSASNYSNGNNTFLFFDDFDSETVGTKWQINIGSGFSDTETANAYIDSPNGVAKLNSVSNQSFISKEFNISRPFCIEARGKIAAIVNAGYLLGVMWHKKDTPNYNTNSEHSQFDNDSANLTHCTTSSIDYQGTAFTPTANTWYILQLKTTSSDVIAKILQDNRTEIGGYTLANNTDNNGSYYVGFDNWSGGTAGTWADFDWLLVRKYVSPEPTFGSAGLEETLSTKTSSFFFNQAIISVSKTAMFTFNIYNFFSKKFLTNFDIQGLRGAPAKIKSIIRDIKIRFRVKSK